MFVCLAMAVCLYVALAGYLWPCGRTGHGQSAYGGSSTSCAVPTVRKGGTLRGADGTMSVVSSGPCLVCWHWVACSAERKRVGAGYLCLYGRRKQQLLGCADYVCVGCK